MRLTHLHVAGYGRYCEFSLAELSLRLTVLLGANDAGKTTLLWFIRQVLFGFPDGRSSDPRYPPLRGGRHGGSLGVVDGMDRDYRIERYAGSRGGTVTVTREGGAPGTRADLEALLGGVTADIFRNLFAFSLFELQQLEKSTTEELRGRIYGAAMTGASALVPRLEGQLADDSKKLLGQGPEGIRALLKRRDELDRQVQESRHDLDRFHELHDRQE